MNVYVKLIEVHCIVFYLCENEMQTVVDIANKGASMMKLLSRIITS